MLETMVQSMRDHGITHLVTVANGEAAPLYFRLRGEAGFQVVDTCREGEAVAVACGLILGGRRAMVSVENFGFFESLDTLRAMAIDMAVPLPLLIGFTGRPATQDAARLEPRLGNIHSQVLLAGQWTEALLDTIGLDHWQLDKNDAPELTASSIAASFNSPKPSALLVESF